MSIVLIKGTQGSGKTLIATALRNNQISNGKGAILVDEGQDGEPRHLLEKGIVAVALEPGTEAKEIPWKPDTMIIIVGAKNKVLDEFEELAPGITKQLGPVFEIDTSRG